MKARLIAAVAALVAAAGVVGWGVASAHPATSTAAGNVRSQTSGLATASVPATSPTPVSSPSAGSAADPTAGMRLVFHQTFTAPLDPAVWGTCYPWASSVGCTNFSNPEYEWYLPSQVQVSGGALRLIASQQPTQGTAKSGQPMQYVCRSGMVTSYPGFRFEYGYVSMVVQIPGGTGMWPGLWLAAANLKWPPEIDMLESWGPPGPGAGVYFHPAGAPPVITHLSPSMIAGLYTGWHTLSVSWTAQKISWYVDGTLIMTITRFIPQQLMYLVADLANYTKTGGCSGELDIKSIDVWQNAA